MIEAVAGVNVIARSGYRILVFVNMMFRGPFTLKQFQRFSGKFLAHLSLAVIPH